ncbi:uncharacterized protein LOC123299089 isoform X2 [Chrysoperla carnea]|uniref:uncharacterized protein LOC123299089 isoform X2 n=1 Tax=Chrysoperla carnea TaxID=189513 RepID=UPI001D08271B|nr:uncharacterized protein LOC123299089 isoform X2 [Chrysoperla carnea]
MSNVDLGPRKTVFIMVIVVGCFAVLWPKVFYPMYAGNVNTYQPKPQDKSGGCCDVIWETDVNAIKIMVDLCGNILKDLRASDPRVELAFESGKLSNDIIEKCRSKVLSTCGVDIALFLKENVLLGRTYRQILDELRSVNSSLCLKYNFGVSADALGVRHSVILDLKVTNVRQERPAHLRPDMLHPALRERGRAIPPSAAASMVANSQQPRVVPGRPGPIPGMRPTIGGAGHVVPPPKQSTSTMGIVMPIYTIGIVIFFTYTLMKIMFKKEDKSNLIYPSVQPDPLFHKRVFNKEYSSEKRYGVKSQKDDPPSTKLVVTALTDMLTEVDQRRELLAKQRAAASNGTTIDTTTVPEHQITELNETSLENINSNESYNAAEIKSNGDISKISEHTNDKKQNEIMESLKEHITNIEAQEEGTTIKVVGMEITESCEGGKPWSRPSSPIAPPLHLETVTQEPPPSIILENKIPTESQILITDSLTNKEIIEDEYDEDNEPTIMLSGKITLSVIPSEINFQKSIEEQKRDEDKYEQVQSENGFEKKLSETPADSS